MPLKIVSHATFQKVIDQPGLCSEQYGPMTQWVSEDTEEVVATQTEDPYGTIHRVRYERPRIISELDEAARTLQGIANGNHELFETAGYKAKRIIELLKNLGHEPEWDTANVDCG